MRWDIGSVYKYIRKSKGITQNEICGDYITHSNLSKFENNHSTPRYDTMELLLRQIDMCFDEFHYICQHYQMDSRKKLFSEYYQVISSPNLEEMKTLLSKCQIYLDEVQNDIPIEHAVKELTIFIEVIENQFSDKAQALAEELWKELEKRDQWFLSDLRLLVMIIFHFPIDSLEMLRQRLVKSLNKYTDYRPIQSIHYSILANMTRMYLEAGKKDDCLCLIQECLDLAKILKRYDLLGVAQVRLGIVNEDHTMINKGLSLLESTDESRLLREMKREVSDYYQADFFETETKQ